MSIILANPFPTTIEQRVTSGNQFDGTLPDTDPGFSSGTFAYPEDTKGGLFDFVQTSPLKLQKVELKLDGGAGATWNLYISNGVSADDVLWITGTDETSFVNTEPLVLSIGQKIKLVTTGATNAMLARLMGKLEYADSGGGL